MKINNPIFQLTLRIIIGIVFIISAISKLIAMDSFEVYIYSFQLLSLNLAFIFARILISFELIIGLFFIFGTLIKPIKLIAIGSLSAFIVFIIYLIGSNNSENCHCFGDLIDLSHYSSIAKNLVLLALVVLVKNQAIKNLRLKKILVPIFILISLSIPFIYSPPDTFNKSYYAKKTDYNIDYLNQFLASNPLPPGKSMLCFYGPTCKFCKLSAKKLNVISNKANFSQSITHVFFGDNKSISNFFEITNLKKAEYISISINDFLKITNGKMPVILLMENEKVQKKYGYRDIDENEIASFFLNQ